MKCNSITFVIILGLAFLYPAFARCQNADKQAEAEFDRGIALYKEGSFKEAAAAFRHANELKPTWSLLFNIAQSEAAAKNYGVAYETFEEYLAKGGDELPIGRRNQVIGELNNLKNLIGSLEVSAPVGAEVIVDGVERGTTPLPGKLKISIAEVHSVEIMKGEIILASKKVKVSQGETAVLEVAAPKPAGAVSNETMPSKQTEVSANVAPPKQLSGPERKTKTPLMRILGWSGIGVGLAVATGGAVTGGITLSISNELDSVCSDNICPLDKQADEDKKDVLALTTDVLLGVGAVVTGVGIGLLVASFRSHKNDEGNKTVSVIPLIGDSTAALAVSGRF
jgi:F0F1-type ATP synthase membrane subunit c/vacuolar-type H+-ATPase subunit K